MNKKIGKWQETRLWLMLLCVLSLVFSYYLITFFWGNHDWDWVKGTSQVLQLNTGMFEGRYGKFILNVFLYGGQILPILNGLTSLAFLALGSIVLTRYWQIDDFASRFVVALLPILSPFVLGWLYFPINILGNFSAVALVAGGLWLGEKEKKSAKAIAVVCFLLALGVYPSTMEMMIICFIFRQILHPVTVKKMFIKATPIIIALLIFKLLLIFLGKFNLVVSDYYNLKTVSVIEFLQRIPSMLNLIVSQLTTSLPFVDIKIKLIGLMIILVAVILSANNLKNLLLWSGALLTTVLSTWLTATPEETAYMPRVNFYGLNFLYTGSVAVLLSKKVSWRNLGMVLSAIILWLDITADIEAQKSWTFGKKSEEQVVERIYSRINEKTAHRVVPIVAGTLSLRPRYYHEHYQKESPYLLNAPFMVRHIPSGMVNFYAVEDIFYGNSQISDMSNDLYVFLKSASKPYPAESSLFIDNHYAVILLTPEGIAAIKAQLPY